jgi:uncharacterized protein YaiE (UPF0345 family)
MGKTFSTGLLTNGIWQDASNNVGIGGSPSGSYKLEVTGKLSVANTYALDPLIRLATTTSGNVEVQMRTATTTYNAGIGVVTSGYDFGLFTNNTTRMTIGSGGSIGMGTTNLIYAALNIKASGAALYNGIALYSTNGTETFLGIGNSGTECGLYATYGANGSYVPITFSTGGSERMRIISGTPTVVIGGTAGAYTSTNRGNLTLSGSASSLLGFHNGTTQTGYIYNDYSANLFQWYSVSNPIEITSTSLGVRLNANATSWSPISSDERTKKNFETTQGLIEVLQIEPVKYHFIEEDDNAVKRLGFKAQNLQPLIPEMVYLTGKKMEDGSDILTITPDYLLPVLVKAIQEQNQIIQELSNRLIKLENK